MNYILYLLEYKKIFRIFIAWFDHHKSLGFL